jgi:hypothetical protein
MTSALIPKPNVRRLRIYAFDPSLSAQFDTAGIGEITVSVPWEANLDVGPVGEYVEVVDADPASGVFYTPVNLNDKAVLAQDGLGPSETNPLFHQQMVYAVAMTTIGHFEQALGRVAHWASYKAHPHDEPQFVRRLRIYPHALRDRNAYYSPSKIALLFGYFPVGVKDGSNTPGTIVYTCLSHDIIAHETTHALLDGVHPRFDEPVNHDVLAFHEAFADIVALFQHFAYPGVLRDQISRTRGDLSAENLLGQLAQQFGKASGRGTALRDALGGRNPETGKWEPHEPDVKILDTTRQPHARGAILVAAVFGAFLKVYRARTLDLYRIASEGTGVLRAGDLPPDLANRLADEAARTSQYVLQMCIRGIDYCPPVGITFGDYLRAVITGDYELNPEDPFAYRLAFIESFRNWGIHPRGMRSMSQEALLWPTLEAAQEEAQSDKLEKSDLQNLFNVKQMVDPEEQTDNIISSTRTAPETFKPWNLEGDRYNSWRGAEDNSAVLWAWLMKGPGQKLLRTLGIVTDAGAPATVYRSRKTRKVAVEVHSVRTALRRGSRGGTPVTDLVVEITQRRRGYFDEATQKQMDALPNEPPGDGDFMYRTGCTILIDPGTLEVRRVIRTTKPIDDNEGLNAMRRFLTEGDLEPTNAFVPARDAIRDTERFALLHRSGEG